MCFEFSIGIMYLIMTRLIHTNLQVIMLYIMVVQKNYAAIFIIYTLYAAKYYFVYQLHQNYVIIKMYSNAQHSAHTFFS